MTKNIILFVVSVCMVAACSVEPQKAETETKIDSLAAEKPITFDLNAANNLASLPLACVQQEYPNKLSQVISSEKDLRTPKDLHPSFYGCYDWHSAVHGHWSLVKLLKTFPELERKDEAIQKLKTNISQQNVLNEIKYWDTKYNSNYERTYGWAWLLKLAEELHTWDTSLARELEHNLQPLTDMIVSKYHSFLPKLVYPIRVGEHTNTAFGLSFAYDYAVTLKDESLKSLITQRAKEFYINDADCPLTWEPSGYDFLSPCLQEADIMSKVLSKEEYLVWLDAFLPQLKDPNFKFPIGKVSDRSDAKLVHLDGVNFSRAWCLYRIAGLDKKYNHLYKMGNDHVKHSLPSLVGDSYEGGHWLGSFAIYACQ